MGDRLRTLTAIDFEVAARAAFAVAVPLLLLLALDRLDLAAYASFGAMTALFGRSEPYRLRRRSLTVAGVIAVASVALGTVLAAAKVDSWVLAIALVVVIVVGVLLVSVFGLFPPTALFFVFALLVCAEVPTPSDELGLRIGIAVASALFAWLVSMSGWLLRRLGGPRYAGLFKDLPRSPRVNWAAVRAPGVWLVIAQNTVGGLVAWAAASAFGLGHTYWAVVSVIAVIPPPFARHSVSRSIHRVGGTALGVIVTAVLLYPEPPVWVIVLAIIVAQFATELLVKYHYGASLIFVTPLALGVAHLASPSPVGPLLVDRLIETALGATIGLCFVLLARWLDKRVPALRIVPGAPPAA